MSCTALLRVIPGRREVYDARWNHRDVVAKVFSHRMSAKRHLDKEWQGLKELRRRGLSSPEPLFYGKTEDGRWIVVIEKIADSATVVDMLNETAHKSKKLYLLVRVCRELARQHRQGVLQKDLHLGNYLTAGNRIYVLDPSEMQFASRQVSRKQSISQLALLVCHSPAGDMRSTQAACREYFEARGWDFRDSDELLLQRELFAHRKTGVKRALKKCVRTSKRYLRIKAGAHTAVFDRAFCEGGEPLDLMDHIDTLMDAGHILKDGNTCYVSRLSWNGKDVVVKRYNHKGFFHSLRQSLRASRARRGWLNGHRLRMLGISTPRPLAYFEQHRGPLLWDCYLVTEYVQGPKLYHFLREAGTTEEQRSTATARVIDMLNSMGEYKISHGDLKHSNIVIAEDGPTITDLDGMKVHKLSWTYKARRAKDIARFTSDAPGGHAAVEPVEGQ